MGVASPSLAASSDSSTALDAQLQQATEDLCSALALGHYCMVERGAELPAGRLGSIIPLVGSVQVQLILLSTNAGVRALAERFLRHEQSDGVLSGDDVRDAIRELSNQFAGLAKRRFSVQGDFRLGLPVFMRGTVAKAHGVQACVHHVRFGDLDVTVAALVSQG